MEKAPGNEPVHRSIISDAPDLLDTGELNVRARAAITMMAGANCENHVAGMGCRECRIRLSRVISTFLGLLPAGMVLTSDLLRAVKIAPWDA